MQHVVTLKMNSDLFNKLESYSKQMGSSKGATIRQAIELQLKQECGESERIQKATQALLAGTKSRKASLNWDEIKKEAAKGIVSGMKPEEEVQIFRRRGL